MDNIQSPRTACPDLTADLEQQAAKQGAKAERNRIQGILCHDEARGRTPLARHLAFETDMEAEAAVSVLSNAPLETPTRDDVSGFVAAMAATPNPEIAPSPEVDGDSEEAVAKRLATY